MRILCVAVVLSASLLGWAGSASAGMSEGVAAVTVGDYDKAIAEFQPLAAAGDPAAQYQLAKIYLEGRGPADGVAQGIALMNKAASGGYPEAQAQLGLMSAMGLGVEADNMKAYDWLTKAVTALPAGTRRTVAEANRDAVLKRMNAAEQTQVAASTANPADMPAAKPTATQETAKKSAAETTAAKATTAKATATTTTAKATTTKTTAAPAATTPKTVTEAAATNKTKTAGTTTGTTTATTTKATASTAKPASGEAKAPEKAPEKAAEKAAEKPAQVASKAPDATPSVGAQKAAPSGVRIQLVSMPSEEAAWAAWKQLSGKYSGQLSGLTAMVEPADLGDKGKFYRVQTGPFTTVAAAQERCTAMKAAGLDCLVVGKP